MTGRAHFWVWDGQVQVDTEELAEAAMKFDWAGDSANQAIQRSSAVAWLRNSALDLIELGPSAHLSLGHELNALNIQIRVLHFELQTALRSLRADLRDHASWLGLAALIYANAELDTAGFVAVCDALAPFAPSLPSCGSALPNGSLGGILSSLPNHVLGMGAAAPNSTAPPVGGLVAGSQIAQFAQENGSGIDPMTGLASGIASFWERLDNWRSGKSLGVVVHGPFGSLQGIITDDGVQTSPVADRQLDQDQSLAVTSRMNHVAAQDQLPPPTDIAKLLDRLDDAPNLDDVGEVHILRHSTPGVSDPSWSVMIRGTQELLPGSDNPQDMLSNFEEVAGQISSRQAGIVAAMEMVGIGPTDPVEFVGHSQGGVVALALAASSQIRRKYNVVSVLTSGSPVSPKKAETVQVLALENVADVIPSLDGRKGSSGQSQHTVYFDPRTLDPSRTRGAHSLETYIEAAQRLHEQAQTDPVLNSIATWEDQRTSKLGLTEQSSTTPLFMTMKRIRQG